MYMSGMHKLIVQVQDDLGQTKTAVSEFSLDNHWSTNFTWVGLIVLLTDLCTTVSFKHFVVIVTKNA